MRTQPTWNVTAKRQNVLNCIASVSARVNFILKQVNIVTVAIAKAVTTHPSLMLSDQESLMKLFRKTPMLSIPRKGLKMLAAFAKKLDASKSIVNATI